MIEQGDPTEVCEELIYVKEERLAYITLNRPEHGNAITPRMHSALHAAWRDADSDLAVRCIIVTGAGDRHFCTGADLTEVVSTGNVGTGSGPMVDEVRISCRQNDVEKPVIAAVNGLCNGAGLHLAVDADIVVAADTAQFLDSHVNVGMVGAVENIGLAKRLPLGQALRMTLQGRGYRLSARRAYELGLVEEVVPGDDLLATATQIGIAIAQNSPEAVRLSKKAIWASLEMGYSDALQNGWDLACGHWSHPDFTEGPRAFVERRAPRWVNQ